MGHRRNRSAHRRLRCGFASSERGHRRETGRREVTNQGSDIRFMQHETRRGNEQSNLKSRQPSFGEPYGMHRLREVANSLNFKTVKLLLALGCYPEDPALFEVAMSH
ncbi:hypothetical protein MRX96_041785 [Rhipicephalus microplus]